MEILHAYTSNINVAAKTVFYCATGKRSGETVKAIIEKHPDAAVFSLAGGLKAWADDGDE
jgi:adenylyltransferase/sulfurtransferase